MRSSVIIKKHPIVVAMSVVMLQFGIASAQKTVESAPGNEKKAEKTNVGKGASDDNRNGNGDAASVETIVVTGTSLPRRKFDAAYANSTLSEPINSHGWATCKTSAHGPIT